MSIGFTPNDGETVHWVAPGANRPLGFTQIHPGAGDPFGAGSGALSLPIFRARYGEPPKEGEVEGVFPVYAESIGTLSRAMELASQDPSNGWGFAPGVPSDLEVYDFAATRCQQGRNSPIFKYLAQPAPTPPDQSEELRAAKARIASLEAKLLSERRRAETAESAKLAADVRLTALKNPSEDIRATVKLLSDLKLEGTLRVGPGVKARLGRFTRWFGELVKP